MRARPDLTGGGWADRPITEVGRALRSGEVTSRELVSQSVERAEHAAETHNAIAHLDADTARATADDLDAELASGHDRGPLHGIPVTIKDLFRVDGFPLTASSRAPLPDVGPDEADAVALLRRAGVVIVATTNLHEVALGITGENPVTGDVTNPFDVTRQAGGSSSGAAVATAVGVGWGALATDTAGSIRIPASHCGLVGIKPTYGMVPTRGTVPLVPICDHVGVLARRVADAELLMVALAGTDVPDPPAADRPRTLGVPIDLVAGRLGAEVAELFDAWLARASETGAHITEVRTPLAAEAASRYFPIVGSWATHVHRRALAAGADVFGAPVAELMAHGAEVRGAELLASLDHRERIRCELAAALDGIDALVLPSAPVIAPLLGTTRVELTGGPTPLRDAFLQLAVPASLVGLPTLAVPMGFASPDPGSTPLPVGVQIVGASGSDAHTMAVARWAEQLA